MGSLVVCFGGGTNSIFGTLPLESFLSSQSPTSYKVFCEGLDRDTWSCSLKSSFLCLGSVLNHPAIISKSPRKKYHAVGQTASQTLTIFAKQWMPGLALPLQILEYSHFGVVYQLFQRGNGCYMLNRISSDVYRIEEPVTLHDMVRTLNSTPYQHQAGGLKLQRMERLPEYGGPNRIPDNKVPGG